MAFSGNLQAQGATFGRSFEDVINQAKSLGFGPEDLLNATTKHAQQDAKFQQGIGMQNQAFGRGLNADQMRQQTYNTMAQNEQQNRFQAAQGLVDAYNQARNTNASLMANTLRF